MIQPGPEYLAALDELLSAALVAHEMALGLEDLFSLVEGEVAASDGFDRLTAMVAATPAIYLLATGVENSGRRLKAAVEGLIDESSRVAGKA